MHHTPIHKGAVLITGASSGIGRACALMLDRSGYRVFAGIRTISDAEALKQLASPLLTPVRLDITDEALIADTTEQISAALDEKGLVGLVNNAGIAVPAPIEIIPLARLQQQFAVNVIGQVAIIQAFLPLLRKAHGRIITIGSVGSSMTFPYAGALSASKAALKSVNDALRMELSPWNIPVILLTLGTVQTPGIDKLQKDSEEFLRGVSEEDVQRYAHSLRAFVAAFRKQESRGASPEVVADVILHALTVKTPAPEYFIGPGSRLLPLLAHLLPTRLLDTIRMRVLGSAHQTS